MHRKQVTAPSLVFQTTKTEQSSPTDTLIHAAKQLTQLVKETSNHKLQKTEGRVPKSRTT